MAKYRLIAVLMLAPGIVSGLFVFAFLGYRGLAARAGIAVGILVSAFLGAAVAVVLGLLDAGKARRQESHGE